VAQKDCTEFKDSMAQTLFQNKKGASVFAELLPYFKELCVTYESSQNQQEKVSEYKKQINVLIAEEKLEIATKTTVGTVGTVSIVPEQHLGRRRTFNTHNSYYKFN